jgi:hypothetical protein
MEALIPARVVHIREHRPQYVLMPARPPSYHPLAHLVPQISSIELKTFLF